MILLCRVLYFTQQGLIDRWNRGSEGGLDGLPQNRVNCGLGKAFPCILGDVCGNWLIEC